MSRHKPTPRPAAAVKPADAITKGHPLTPTSLYGLTPEEALAGAMAVPLPPTDPKPPRKPLRVAKRRPKRKG